MIEMRKSLDALNCREERICGCCIKNEVENKIHFVCICNAYNVVRSMLYKKVSLAYPNFNNLAHEDKFIYLMKNHR